MESFPDSGQNTNPSQQDMPTTESLNWADETNPIPDVSAQFAPGDTPDALAPDLGGIPTPAATPDLPPPPSGPFQELRHTPQPKTKEELESRRKRAIAINESDFAENPYEPASPREPRTNGHKSHENPPHTSFTNSFIDRKEAEAEAERNATTPLPPRPVAGPPKPKDYDVEVYKAAAQINLAAVNRSNLNLGFPAVDKHGTINDTHHVRNESFVRFEKRVLGSLAALVKNHERYYRPNGELIEGDVIEAESAAQYLRGVFGDNWSVVHPDERNAALVPYLNGRYTSQRHERVILNEANQETQRQRDRDIDRANEEHKPRTGFQEQAGYRARRRTVAMLENRNKAHELVETQGEELLDMHALQEKIDNGRFTKREQKTMWKGHKLAYKHIRKADRIERRLNKSAAGKDLPARAVKARKLPGRVVKAVGRGVRAPFRHIRENVADNRIEGKRAQVGRLRIEASFHDNGNDVANLPTNKDMGRKASRKRTKASKLSREAAWIEQQAGIRRAARRR